MTRNAQEAHPDPAEGDGFDELAVADPSFLLERFGQDTHPLQFLRELTVNSFQGIKKIAPEATGRVVWDVDWELVEATNGRQRKLSISDTGCGMTAAEMRYFINHLAATGQAQGHARNHGVGAKLAAGFRNPHGVQYRSWTPDGGAQVVFGRHQDGRWGLKQQRGLGPDSYWLDLSDVDRAWLLRDSQTGTVVTLLGTSDTDDTTKPPKVAEVKSTWITKHLNQRFFAIPEGIELLVREGNEVKVDQWTPGELTRVLGQSVHLERRSIDSGTVELPATDAAPAATVLWWILDDDKRGRDREGKTWASTGHIAALFQDELYSFPPPTKGGYTRLQSEFGIRFGYERTVLYVIPHLDEDELLPNTPRTELLVDGEPLPWAGWGEQFRELMPTAIRQLQERVAGDGGSERRIEVIGARLREWGTFLAPRRYRPPVIRQATPTIADPLHEPPPADGGPAGHTPADESPLEDPAGEAAHGEPGDLLEHSLSEPRTDADHDPALDEDLGGADDPPLEIDLPEIVWVTVRDQSRAPGDLEDRAARYDRTADVLTINGDFRVYTGMVQDWLVGYPGVTGARAKIEATVREWYEQALIELVIGIKQLAATSPRWNDEDVDAVLGDERAVTAAVIPRTASLLHMRKSLSQALGRPTSSAKKGSTRAPEAVPSSEVEPDLPDDITIVDGRGDEDVANEDVAVEIV